MHGRSEGEGLGGLHTERCEHRSPPQPRDPFGLREPCANSISGAPQTNRTISAARTI